jgi:hypothetical protein
VQPDSSLVKPLLREEIARGRRMSDEAKLLAGAELFDYACEISKSGIHHDHPEYDERQVLEELRRRLRRGERLRGEL